MMQKLNLMDYSLLVGIHDCTLTSDPSEEEGEAAGGWGDDNEEDGNGYVSSDDVGDAPQSPRSPGPRTPGLGEGPACVCAYMYRIAGIIRGGIIFALFTVEFHPRKINL